MSNGAGTTDHRKDRGGSGGISDTNGRPRPVATTDHRSSEKGAMNDQASIFSQDANSHLIGWIQPHLIS